MRRSMGMSPRSRRYPFNKREIEDVPLTAISWRRLYRYLRPYAGRMVVVIIALGLSSAASLAFPLMIVRLLESVLSQQNQGQRGRRGPPGTTRGRPGTPDHRTVVERLVRAALRRTLGAALAPGSGPAHAAPPMMTSVMIEPISSGSPVARILPPVMTAA